MATDPQELTQEALEAFRRGAGPAALAISNRAIEAGGAPPDAYAVRGLCLRQRNEIHKAIPDLEHAVLHGSEIKEVVLDLSDGLRRMMGPKDALERLEQLLEQRPAFAPLRVAVANAYGAQQRLEEELLTLAKGLEASPDDPDLLGALVTSYLALGRAKEALPIALRLANRAPEDAEAAHILGNAYLQAGKMDQAREAYLEALQREPAYPRSFMSLSRLGSHATVEDQLDRLLADAEQRVKRANDEDAPYLYYGIGHFKQRQGAYPEAFRAYKRGGAIRARTMPYDAMRTAREVEVTKSFFNARFFEGLAEHEGPDEPIFIVGLPRSGSTLIEQILSCHSGVEALGEVPVMPRLVGPVIDALARNEQPLFDPEKLRSEYLSAMGTYRQQQTPRFTDKTLITSHLVGAVHAAFPKAPILYADRYILDVCASCFSLRFAAGHHWSYRLSDMAHFIQQHRSVMAHWDEVLPGRITRVDYDALVNDVEGGVRALLEACNLPWEEACLAPHESQRAVATSSNVQVRQPVNTDSRGRWRRFEAELAPLREALLV